MRPHRRLDQPPSLLELDRPGRLSFARPAGARRWLPGRLPWPAGGPRFGVSCGRIGVGIDDRLV
ncbi:MAG: hypothetical protein ACKON8_13695, partial [Planctomycetota bacterium]